MSNNSSFICFGDVIKLSTKSAFADPASDSCCLGFLEQKSSLLLVVPPTKDEVKDKFVEAEFVVAPIRGDKPPAKGTPLNYKQPFVLKTSDGSGYSLNNKTPNQSDVVSLQVSGIKGEMYVTVEKEGFAAETHVQDGDMNVELTVVDSNRIRKNYNNKSLTHFTKSKSDAPGGFVSCGAKGQVLTFKLIKVSDTGVTTKYIKDPVFRRASQELLDPVKADETSEASVLESPSRAGSIVAAGPLIVESVEAKVEVPEAPAVEVSVPMSVSESTAAPVIEAKSPTPKPVDAAPGGVNPADLASHLAHVVLVEEVADVPDESMEEPQVAVTATPVEAVVALATETSPVVAAFTGLDTIELSAASEPAMPALDMESMDGSAPVHFKLVTPSTKMDTPTKTVSAVATTASDLNTLSSLTVDHEEHVDTACVGKCSIM